MDTQRAAVPAAGSTELAPAQIAKAALRSLAVAKLEPTPENYARAYRHEAGVEPAAEPRVAEREVPPAPEREAPPVTDGKELAGLIERIVRGVERGGRNWTSARKKDSLQRVLAGSRSDAQRLQQRLSQLVASWDSDTADSTVEGAEEGADADAGTSRATRPAALDTPAPRDADPRPVRPGSAHWDRVVDRLGGTVQQALPPAPAAGAELAATLAALNRRIVAEQATPPLADELEQLCLQAERVLQHRHHLVDQLGGLCGELTDSLTELAENDSWARGQCDAMRLALRDGLTARGVRSVSALLRTTRERQGQLRSERERARDALKSLINRMLGELGELGQTTGRFHESVARYADVIDKADTLESLAGVVREMVEESRTVQLLVQQAQQRLQSEHDKASGLTQRVAHLEGELRRLSDEVSTDPLTQIANRRGLMLAFEAERSRLQRGGGTLAVGLLDIDNFKRLNDEHGHSVGDEALKALAEVVKKTLRPTDRVARYGGEEFVVLLPDTPVMEAQQILTRLQRSLTGGLFMHEQRQMFVTFSAGVTAYREAERIEDALERADQALYEAKRTGKNRTCLG